MVAKDTRIMNGNSEVGFICLETRIDPDRMCVVCHGRFQFPNHHDNRHSNGGDGTVANGDDDCLLKSHDPQYKSAIENKNSLQNKKVEIKSSQIYTKYDAKVSKMSQSCSHGSRHHSDADVSGKHTECYLGLKNSTQGHCSSSRSPKVDTQTHRDCTTAAEIQRCCLLEQLSRSSSGHNLMPCDQSLPEVVQSHNSQSNPAKLKPATTSCQSSSIEGSSESSTLFTTRGVWSWSPSSASFSSLPEHTSANQNQPHSSSKKYMQMRSPNMTSLSYAMILLVLSVMSQNAPLVAAQEPEWITEPSNTKIAEFGTQRLYCRIRNRGNRGIAWIQYQRDGNVRNLFIDDERWAAPDRRVYSFIPIILYSFIHFLNPSLLSQLIFEFHMEIKTAQQCDIISALARTNPKLQ